MNASLKLILDRYPVSIQPIAEPTPLGNAGGLSGAKLWRFPSTRGPLVARLWPMEAHERLRIERIHSWITRTDRLGFVPIPCKARDGSTVQEALGRLWDVSPWMAGEADPASPPNPDHVKSAFGALAEFHLAMGEITPAALSPGLASRRDEIEALISRDLKAWHAIVSRFPLDVVREMAEKWITLAEQIAPPFLVEIRLAALKVIAIQPVLRDTRPGHFLFTSDRVTGLADFGAMGIDAVSADLGRLASEWLPADNGPLRAEAISAYEQIRPLAIEEKDRILAFERSAGFLRGARWIRWHFVEKIAFPDASAVVRGLTQSVDWLTRNSLTPASGLLPRPSSTVLHLPS